MSKRSSSKTKRQGSAKDVQSTKEHTDSSTSEISDTLERRRMQNRLAQRNHRKKVRDHIKALEARVINSMLQCPPPYVLPLPQVGQPQSSTAPLYPFPHQTTEQHFRSSSETVDRSYVGSRTTRSPSASSPSSEYPASPPASADNMPYLTPAPSSISLPSLHPSPIESRTPGVTFEIIPQRRASELEPVQLQRIDRVTYQSEAEYGNYVGIAQNTNELSDFDYLSMEPGSGPASLPRQCSVVASPMGTPGGTPHSHFISPHQEREWLNSLSMNSPDHAQTAALNLHHQYQSPERFDLPETNLYSVPQTPCTIMSTAHHYFEEPQPHHFSPPPPPPPPPTEAFHPSMAIYRSPKYGH